MHGILTTPLYATPNLERLPLGEAFREPPFIILAVALNIVGFIFVAWALRPRAAEEPDEYELAASAALVETDFDYGEPIEPNEPTAAVVGAAFGPRAELLDAPRSQCAAHRRRWREAR